MTPRTLSAPVLCGLSIALTACSLVVDGSIRDPMMMAGACEGIDDGTPCERAGIAAPLICLRGVCTNSRGGDGLTGTGSRTRIRIACKVR